MTSLRARNGPGDVLRVISDLRDYLTSGREVPMQSRKILLDALNTCIAGDFQPCLFAAIGLKARGGVSLERYRRLADRDAQIVQLWRDCDEYSGLPAGRAAKSMAAAFRSYQVRRWPREYRGSMPEREPTATWWRILSENERVPEAKRLQQILENAASQVTEADKATPLSSIKSTEKLEIQSVV